MQDFSQLVVIKVLGPLAWHGVTYMIMEGYFHQQVCPFGLNIPNKRNNHVEKLQVDKIQGRHLADKKIHSRHAPQHRIGPVMLSYASHWGLLGTNW